VRIIATASCTCCSPPDCEQPTTYPIRQGAIAGERSRQFQRTGLSDHQQQSYTCWHISMDLSIS